MEQSSFDLSTVIRPMSVVTEELIKYIEGRKDKVISSLRTRWNKFNTQCMGGIEPNTVYTIAGISGSGNIIFINCNLSDMITRYKNKKCV